MVNESFEDNFAELIVIGRFKLNYVYLGYFQPAWGSRYVPLRNEPDEFRTSESSRRQAPNFPVTSEIQLIITDS